MVDENNDIPYEVWETTFVGTVFSPTAAALLALSMRISTYGGHAEETEYGRVSVLLYQPHGILQHIWNITTSY